MLRVYQERHYSTEYQLRPDGTIDEASEKDAAFCDDDGELDLVCMSCGFNLQGERDMDDGTRFQYLG